VIPAGAAAVFFCIVAVNVLAWRKLGRGVAPEGSISILIPARNEEFRLPGCLESLLSQTACEILVYDDHSEDRTAGVIDGFALRDARIRRLEPAPLPEGWCGKNFACSQLAAHAAGDWMLFLDADVRVAPGAAARIAAEAERRSLTMLSCWPRFAMSGFWENTLMPMLNFLVFCLFPAPLAYFFGHPSLGLAHGACILTRRDVYRRLGGHSLVRREIFEDTRLAQLWRTHGERSLCLDGQDLVEVRMYSGFSEIWQGFQKNFAPAFRHRINFWLFLILHFSVFLLPFLLGNLFAIALVLSARALLAARFRGQKWWSVLLHPLGESVLIALALTSWWKCRSGQGALWKGRVVRI
jgi:glycosyltransferase involved in cell wall biosynthesis